MKTAGLSLERVETVDVAKAAATWEKVIARVRSGAMPPAGRPRPDRAAQAAFVTNLESELDAASASHPEPGRPTLHRLNRSEYGNAIRDLLALDIDVTAFLPANDAAYGFDNNADALTLSPVLLERYMSAARKISRLAVGDARMRPVTESYQVSALLNQDDQMGEDLPFGSRGGLGVRHYFPVDGDYQLLELSPALEPLAPFRKHLVVVTGLDHKPAAQLPGEPAGGHGRIGGVWLTGVHAKPTEGADLEAGISLDQIAAPHVSAETELPSLEVGLGAAEFAGACDAGFSCAYTSTLCWRTPRTPLPMESSPRAVFERLFGDSDSTDPAVRRARRRQGKSLLDAVTDKRS